MAKRKSLTPSSSIQIPDTKKKEIEDFKKQSPVVLDRVPASVAPREPTPQPNEPILPFSPRPTGLSRQERIQPLVTTSEAAGANFDLLNQSAIYSAHLREEELDRLRQNDEPLLEPLELNRLFPTVDRPFTNPTKLSVAKVISERADERHRLSQMVNLKPDGFLSAAAVFGAGLGGALYDRGEFALGVGSGLLTFGAGTVARVGLLGTRVRNAAQASRFGFKTELALGFTEASISEFGFVAPSDESELQDNDTLDSLVGITAGVFTFVAGRRVIGKTIDFFKNRGAGFRADVQESILNQVDSGRSPRVDGFVDELVNERNGLIGVLDPDDAAARARPVGQTFTHERAGSIQELLGRDFFLGASPEMIKNGQLSLRGRGTDPLVDSFMEGIHLTTNQIHANGVAGSRSFNRPGKIFRFKLSKDAVMIDLDVKLDGKAKEIITGLEPEFFKNKKVADILSTDNGATVLDIIRDGVKRGLVRSDIFERIQKSLDKGGFDGFVTESGFVMGRSVGKHDVAILFSDKNLFADGTFRVDSDAVPKLGGQKLLDMKKDVLSLESLQRYDKKVDVELNKKMKEPPPPPPEETLKKDLDDFEDEVAELQAIKEVSETEVSGLKELQRLDEVRNQLSQMAASCVFKG